MSCDSLANLADYTVFGRSGKKRINLKKLYKSKIVFIRTHELERIVSEFGPKLKCRVILTGNSDHNLTVPFTLPNSVKYVYAQNCGITSDDRFKVLPIGIENLRGGRSGLKKYHLPPLEHKIKDKIYLPPMAPTNPIRYEIIYEASKRPDIFIVDRQYKSEWAYFSLVKSFKFIFCCEGNGFENHRIWESFYQNSFPVMLKSDWSVKLGELGLPILYIEGINEVNQETLEEFSHQNRNFDCTKEPVLWTPYWKSKFQDALRISN